MKESFDRLFQSSHLGITIANLERVIEANDAFLHMIEYSRDEFIREGISMRKMTPHRFARLDQKALDQLRIHGVAIPYEKAFVLRDGKRVDFVVGSVPISEEPLVWASYVIDLSETKRLREAEHELQARARIVNQLAHELNNPLAALTFLLHAAWHGSGIAREPLQTANAGP